MAYARPSDLHQKRKTLEVKKENPGATSQYSPVSPWFSHFNAMVLGKKSKDPGRGVSHLLKLATQAEDIPKNTNHSLASQERNRFISKSEHCEEERQEAMGRQDKIKEESPFRVEDKAPKKAKEYQV